MTFLTSREWGRLPFSFIEALIGRMETDEILLNVKGLYKTYQLEGGGKVEALENVSFELKRGEILGVIGRSGGGKSTLIRILRGSLPFERGEIRIGGITITPSSPPEMVRKLGELTGLHLQRSFGLWEGTVLENVMRRLNALETGDETAPLPPEDSPEFQELRERGRKILERMGLAHKANHPAFTLSGGEKQRLVLARQLPLAGRSPLLLLDEPVTMTCPATKRQAVDEIKRVREEWGVSVLVASHLPSLLLALSDRVMWLEKRVVEIGAPKEVISHFLSGLEPPLPLSKPKRRILLHVRNLRKKYYAEVLRETFELQGVSFSVREGEILSIVGPSGVGKTVLLRLLSGLELPDEGEVIYRMEGKTVDITKLSYRAMEVRRRIGRIHQELDLPYHATVKELAMARVGVKGERALAHAKLRAKELGLKEEVADALYRLTDYPEREAEARLRELGLDMNLVKELFPVAPWQAVSKIIKPTLRLCRLPEEAVERKTFELSWGERIRLAIALELLFRPRILFLDEPFGDLDPLTLRGITNVLKLLNKELGLTMIVVSHHLDFVREVSHRALLLLNGRLVKEGSPEEVIRAFREIPGAEFLSELEG